MAVEMYDRIQESLTEKRQAVNDFLRSATEAEKEICLDEDETCVEEHLHVIDNSLEKVEEQTLGLCVVCHGYVEPGRLEMDYTAHICLDHYSPEERRRLESELELSQVVQRALLPQQIPNISGMELAAFHRPSEIIGGDYFDFFRFRDGAPGLVIADVSGHGVSAGMLMSSLQTALRTLAPESDSPADILERINRFYIHNINFTTFVTVFLARLDPGMLTLTYTNAGHMPPVVARDGAVAWLRPTAPAIGLAEDFHPRTETVSISDGDALLLYTDGVTEVVNGRNEEFGLERLAELVRENRGQTALGLLQAVREGANEFGENRPLADDVTLVALKVAG